ncbi:putative membrane protein [Geminocystis sp. NIES-3708]|nr:putative membrane protein [Geminocystis sp. NIES-3708]
MIENNDIKKYQTKDSQLISKVIDFLENEKKQNTKIINLKDCNKDIKEWIFKHLKGNNEGSIFTPKLENNYYILSSYPSLLSNSVPRSPVYYAPTLLTALGILGTFLGIFLGLQEIGISGINNTQSLLDSSTKLLEGMKTAFSTSLAGMSGAIFMMGYLAKGAKSRQKIRNDLRLKLSKIAFLESPQKLLSRLDNSSMEDVAQNLEIAANNLSSLGDLTPENIALAIQKAIISDESILIKQLQLQTQSLDGLSNLTPENIASTIQKVIALEKSVIFAELQKQNDYLQHLTPANIQQVVRDAIAIEKVAIVEELQAQNRYLQNLTPVTIANVIQPLVKPIQEELTALKQIQIEQESTIQSLIKQLRNELIEPVVQRLDQSAKLTEEASLAVRELKDELGGIAESLSGAVKTIQEFQRDTLIKLQEFAQSLQQILNQFSGDTKDVLQQVAEEINNAVAESITGMEAQRKAFEESANSAANTFRGIREDLQEALTTQATQQKEMLEGVKNSTESILEKTTIAFTQQTETIKNVGEEASQLMSQAKENLLETLKNIDTILDQTRITLQEELERFRLEYQVSLTEFFTQQNNLLEETLGKQKEGLAEVVNNLQTTFKEEAEMRKELSHEVNQSLGKIQETVKIVNNLVNVVGMNSSERFAQLQELAYTIGNEAQKVENSYQKMNEKVNNNVEVMTNKFEETITKIVEEFNQLSTNTNTQINNYLTNASNSYNESFNDADKAMANICSKLSYTSHGLMNVAEYLVASVNDLKQNNLSNN